MPETMCQEERELQSLRMRDHVLQIFPACNVDRLRQRISALAVEIAALHSYSSGMNPEEFLISSIRSLKDPHAAMSDLPMRAADEFLQEMIARIMAIPLPGQK